jgi:Retroviral aspartyl protease
VYIQDRKKLIYKSTVICSSLVMVNNTPPISALADTGASAFAFVHERFTLDSQLPFIQIENPIPLYSFKGDLVQRITHLTRFPLQMGTHSESAIAYVTSTCKHDLVLGLPWFEKHNPHIDFKQRNLVFNYDKASPTTVPYFNRSSDAVSSVSVKGPSEPQPTVPSRLVQLKAATFIRNLSAPGVESFALSMHQLDEILAPSFSTECSVCHHRKYSHYYT